MKPLTRWIGMLGLATFAAVALISVRIPAVHAQAAHIRWDIVHFTSFSPPAFEAGGNASAHANDNSTITLTGSGTFVAPGGGDGTSSAVTGGGNWETFSSTNVSTGSGTYEVTGLVGWEEAPGSLPSAVDDDIGENADAHSGLVVLRIRYSDGSDGVLAVSCHLPAGTPNSIFEGITASKGFTDYWNRVGPLPNVDGNRTVFHTVR